MTEVLRNNGSLHKMDKGLSALYIVAISTMNQEERIDHFSYQLMPTISSKRGHQTSVLTTPWHPLSYYWSRRSEHCHCLASQNIDEGEQLKTYSRYRTSFRRNYRGEDVDPDIQPFYIFARLGEHFVAEDATCDCIQAGIEGWGYQKDLKIKQGPQDGQICPKGRLIVRMYGQTVSQSFGEENHTAS
ncbi:hypothetical protein V2G26_015448 [Clonostachys chloroleuca]